MLKQITEWNTVKKIWMIGEQDLFSQQYKPYSARWPISGMMRNGVVYELPMQVHPTTVSESSLSPTLPTPNTMEHREVKTPEQIAELKKRSPGGYRNLRESVINELPDAGLLRTPVAIEGEGGAVSAIKKSALGRVVMLRDEMIDLAVENGLPVSSASTASLLPTPAVGHIRNHDEPIENYLQRRQDFIDGRTKGMPGASLGVAVRMEMLPTVTTQDAKNNAGKSQFERNTLPLNAEVTLLGTPRVSAANSSTPKQVQADAPKSRIEDQVLITNWGKFEPAIRRWEELTRVAPAPTKPDGKDGNHRLSAEFTEWMMGLPEGWVTAEDIGLKRNDQLKACGNGVVPQQAELALRILLDGLTFEPENSGGGR